jgi:hypothetical protein
MKSFSLITLALLILTITQGGVARVHPVNKDKKEEQVNKDRHETTENHEAHDDHDENKDHEDHNDDHKHETSGEDHESNSQVGPGKGILEASESEGIKLSPEAEKNFQISRIKVFDKVTKVPKQAILKALAERNIYRLRSGFYKRIDFVEINRTTNEITIQSKDLKPGDEIVIQGLGYLRTAEIAAFGGAPEGHSH